MIVANYWAEARRQHGLGRHKITVQRWGWSDTSEAEAQAMAEVRADEALAQAQRDAATPRRERKTAYNGAQGLPIREEVLQRQGDAVITRNGYGAECLNTRNVLFADVDFETRTSNRLRLAAAALLAVAVLLPALWLLGGMLAWVVGVGALLLLTLPLAALLQRGVDAALGGPHVRALAGLRAFIERHPAWAVRVYRTPAGLRLLATQGLVDPVGAEAQEFFAAVGADPVYVRMCLNQRCFRARLTGKPWRMGIHQHMRPRPGVWPVRPEQLRLREEWMRHYEDRAAQYAACHWIESLGSGAMHLDVRPVVELHDRLSGALEPQRPLA
ncbi:hypothetical protein [Acidovorax sp.]|uniref:hypothetical protein n=1 Tax=Acidovorax sp. TaxID=1872122 RepID=UPI003919959E